MYYVLVTLGALFMVLSMRGLSATEIVVIFAVAAWPTYILTQAWCRFMNERARQQQIAADNDN